MAGPLRQLPGGRLRITVRGRVQGVGFRPFVYRLARVLGLAGWVLNDARGVEIEVQGPPAAVADFVRRLEAECPSVARIQSLDARPVPEQDERDFRILESRGGGRREVEISPDLAVCADCLRELFDPADRRFQYPFINCTYCGPRYSIVRSVPYDRRHTTMAAFTMCAACQAEYEDPGDRRFHAQPNACPVCGPRVWLSEPDGRDCAGDPVAACAELLQGGGIVAIKGIGGFHLACRADREEAVERLRRLKGREAKPFALMVPSLEAAERLADLGSAGIRELLTGPERPIVLAPRRAGAVVADAVAPGNPALGVLLPYTPLHHLLFAQGLGPLVMTSANPSEEPLCCGNAEALERLAGMADAYLLHDRGIERRVDDSVFILLEGEADGKGSAPTLALPLRRARGAVPAVIPVPEEASEPVLALGGEMKSTICLLEGSGAVLSEHLGELSHPAAFRNFVSAIECFQALLRIRPRAVAHDLHPDYTSTRHALSLQGVRAFAVQHHHAHFAACLADNGLSGPALGVVCDGTGYGTDGAVWGCEIFEGDATGFERRAHLCYYPAVGGDAAAREAWRPALSMVRQAFGTGWRGEAEALFAGVDPEVLRIQEKRLDRAEADSSGRPEGMTSSLGRLFDAAAFLLGVCDGNRYEAEAAMRLEAEARGAGATPSLPWRIDVAGPTAGLDMRPAVAELVRLRRAGRPPGELARAFHATLVELLAAGVSAAAERSGLRRVALSGGCFANRLLWGGLKARLEGEGFAVFSHRQTPAGDGCVALGQAVVAAARIRGNGS